MATVDELLAAETTESDDELSFLIDEHLRIITVPERGVVLGVEGDKDVNRVRFRMNRYYHGSDLSSFQIRINYQNADGEVNYFTVSDKTVDLQLCLGGGRRCRDDEGHRALCGELLHNRQQRRGAEGVSHDPWCGKRAGGTGS